MAENKLLIISSQGVKYLCKESESTYYNVSNPMINFEENEDVFEIVPLDESYKNKLYLYQEKEVYLRPILYPNGWLALCLQNPNDKNDYIVLTVNLEISNAIGLPDCTFIDINNQPEALSFLINNGIGKDIGYTRQSGFVNYPMVSIDLALLYQHSPETFDNII